MSSGSMSSANSSLKTNRDSRRSKKSGFKANNRDVRNSSGTKTELKFKEVSKYQLEEVKSRLKKEIKQRKSRNVIITIVLTIVVVLAIYKLIF